MLLLCGLYLRFPHLALDRKPPSECAESICASVARAIAPTLCLRCRREPTTKRIHAPLIALCAAQSESVASGGLLIGSIPVFLRALPAHLCAALIRQTTMMINVKDEDAAFAWVKEWVPRSTAQYEVIPARLCRLLVLRRVVRAVILKPGESGLLVDRYGQKGFLWLDDPDGMRIEFYLRPQA